MRQHEEKGKKPAQKRIQEGHKNLKGSEGKSHREKKKDGGEKRLQMPRAGEPCRGKENIRKDGYTCTMGREASIANEMPKKKHIDSIHGETVDREERAMGKA